MRARTIVLLLSLFLYSVECQKLDEYVKTEGAWLYDNNKRFYGTDNEEECALKCDVEPNFLCRSFIYSPKTQKCITLPGNSKSTSLLRSTSSILYEKRIYLLECKKGTGTDYRGTESKTATGILCQAWSSTVPHIPNITPEKFPNAGLESNYCRNPDGDTKGPWCYTTESGIRFDYCNIQECEEDCMHCNGKYYRGNISKTESGLDCQSWDLQTPHTHGYLPPIFPEKDLKNNYCRNPDGEPRPWCFTSSPSKRWEYCSIPRCSTTPPTTHPGLECLSGNGESYIGKIAVTVSGKDCQAWSSQTPHRHHRIPDNYPCKKLDKNYCRNPDEETMPWCYTTDNNTRWEYCQIPSCNGAPPDVEIMPEQAPSSTEPECYVDNGKTYRGTTCMTISGKKCQAWNSMSPHVHTKTPEKHPLEDLSKNYCRNPDNDISPWCYTTDPSVRWEYCNLQKCSVPTINEVQHPVKKPETSSSPIKPEVNLDCLVGRGEHYRGTRSTTVKGHTCQVWTLQNPQQHSSFTPVSHPNAGLDSNYCRNPDRDINGPWCFITTPGSAQWDYCDIPKCAPTEIKCGIPSRIPRKCSGRIVGGCVSFPHSWPWQISLRTSSGVHFCGGTLIAPEWVLTADHCLAKSSRPSFYKVYLGIHREAATEATKQVRDVVKLIKGPSRADIALLKLSSPVLITDEVLPACLPPQDYVVPDRLQCHVTGWGDTHGTGGDGVLKEAGFPVIENKVCNRPEFLSGKVKSTELCAGHIHGGIDSCQGDSGGPLVCPEGNQFILQGVTSWGLGCAQPMKPGVYVRVSTYIPWIDETIKENS
uniref:Plasminogen n=1 Tax=Geotrypetes seraphini TaxID=260995 RepID=A0A6P8Q2S9_GEOSA|nr:plasminogen [Geotrypetes seraphini]